MGKLNILVLGDGLLGKEIVKQTNWNYISRRKDGLEFDKPGTYYHLLKPYKLILNCIAFTDTYSKNRQKHIDINYKYVNLLARYCRESNKKLIHISSDYVYANNINIPSEEDIPYPAENWYSYSKLLGDNAVHYENDNNLVIRCTHKPYPFPYDQAWKDQIGNFDYVNKISELIIKLINKQLTGLYNVGTPKKTMHDLASQTREVLKTSTPDHVPKNLEMNLSKFSNHINRPLISVAIPTYGYNGNGTEFLKYSLNRIKSQTFQDFNLIISDHSQDNTIENICNEFRNELNIVYEKNSYGRGNIAANLNNCLRLSNGIFTKILFQDDFLYSEYSLEYLATNLNHNTMWAVNSCEHTRDNGQSFFRPFTPVYNHNIHLGNNTLSCPSSLTIKNIDDKIYFDDSLNWLMDCDYYKRLYNKFGYPQIIDNIITVNRIHKEQLSETMSLEQKNAEYSILKEKFA